MKTPTLEDLECLNTYPKGTVGYWEERALVQDLLELCQKDGFGRVSQLSQLIEEIWRDGDEAISRMKEDKAKHFSRMRKGWKEAFGQKPCPYTKENM